MKVIITITAILAIATIVQVIPTQQSYKSILSSAIAGVYFQNNIRFTEQIMECINQQNSQKMVSFIEYCLLKGATGSSSQVISLIQDLHNFYDQVSSDVKQCVSQSQELLKLSYKYGIGNIPLAEQQFANYAKSKYLKIHKIFSQILQKWKDQQNYYQAGLLFAQYGHQIFPVLKKYIKGTWLTNVASSALDSLSNIQATLQICSKAGINTIFVVVYNNARTIYPSDVMYSLIGIKQQQKFSGRDPLKQLIEVAKSYKIEIHAWFQYGFSSSYNAAGGPIISKKPNWKAVDSSGKLVTKNGFDWLNAFDPEVQQFMINLFKEVIKNYQVSGVQGDDRLPALPSTAGYENYTIQLYKSQHKGKAPPMNYTDQQWIIWRVDKLNQFMKKLSVQVRKLKPTIYLSVAPNPYPWSKYEYLQDWPTWAKYNWIDAVIPQCYRYNIGAYSSVLQQQLSLLENEKITFASGILLNVGDYVANVTFLEDMVNKNNKSNLDGESFFFYEGIVKQLNWFQNNYKTQQTQTTMNLRVYE